MQSAASSQAMNSRPRSGPTPWTSRRASWRRVGSYSAVRNTRFRCRCLVILLFWITITFASYGLFAPRNTMVITVLFLCSVSVGSALFLVLEMDSPFTGMLRISPEPLQFAYAHLNQ